MQNATSTAQPPVSTVPKTRAPRRCQQCQGKPLRSQCEHTVTGRAYLAEQRAEENIRRQGADEDVRSSSDPLTSPVVPETTANFQHSSPFVRNFKFSWNQGLTLPFS